MNLTLKLLHDIGYYYNKPMSLALQILLNPYIKSTANNFTFLYDDTIEPPQEIFNIDYNLYYNFKLINIYKIKNTKDCLILNDLNVLNKVPKFIKNVFNENNPYFIIHEQIKKIENNIIFKNSFSDSFALIIKEMNLIDVFNEDIIFLEDLKKTYNNNYLSTDNQIKFKILKIKTEKLLNQSIVDNITYHTYKNSKIKLIKGNIIKISNREYFNYFQIITPLEYLKNKKNNNIILNMPSTGFVETEYGDKKNFPLDIYNHQLNNNTYTIVKKFSALTQHGTNIQLNHLDTSPENQLLLLSQIINNFQNKYMQEHSEGMLEKLQDSIINHYTYQYDSFTLYVMLTQLDILNKLQNQKKSTYTICGEVIEHLMLHINNIKSACNHINLEKNKEVKFYKFEGFDNGKISGLKYINTIFDFCALFSAMLFNRNQIHKDKMLNKDKKIIFATSDDIQILTSIYTFNYDGHYLFPKVRKHIRKIISNKNKDIHFKLTHQNHFEKIFISQEQHFQIFFDIISNPKHKFSQKTLIKKNLLQILNFYDKKESISFLNSFLYCSKTTELLRNISGKNFNKDEKHIRYFFHFFWFKFQQEIHKKNQNLYQSFISNLKK